MTKTLPWSDARTAVCETARQVAQRGLVMGTSGNVSQRLRHTDRDLLAITPSGRPYDKLTPDAILVIDFEGEPVEGEGIPSTETLSHVAIYRARPDVGAVIHTHSVYATVAAVAGLDIPPIVDETVLIVGGPILVAKYGFPSSQELADNVVAALEERNAVLLRNHGLIGVGAALEQALSVCELVERTAKVFILARLLGGAHPLPKEVVETEKALYHMRRAAETE